MAKGKFTYKIWRRRMKIFGGLQFWVCEFEGLLKKMMGVGRGVVGKNLATKLRA